LLAPTPTAGWIRGDSCRIWSTGDRSVAPPRAVRLPRSSPLPCSSSMRHSPPRRLVALVDCANFYVACERLFRPDLATVPVAVLSNNDGCIVARSEEVKAL